MESGIEEERRLGTLSVIKVPALKVAIPVSIVHRRNGYLGAAARALLVTITGGVKGGAGSLLSDKAGSGLRLKLIGQQWSGGRLDRAGLFAGPAAISQRRLQQH
jgi:hypothetical protein